MLRSMNIKIVIYEIFQLLLTLLKISEKKHLYGKYHINVVFMAISLLQLWPCIKSQFHLIIIKLNASCNSNYEITLRYILYTNYFNPHIYIY